MGSVADSVVADIRTIIDEYRLFSKGNDTKVDFFDIFVFDNVKSGLKIIHYQPNKMGFKVKVLPTLLSTFAFLQRCFITISCQCVILFHNLFFNPAVIVLHKVDALNITSHNGSVYHPCGKPRAFKSISGNRMNNHVILDCISLLGDITLRKYLMMHRSK